MSRTLLTGTILRSGSIPTSALGGGVVSSSAQITSALPVGTVSSSAQVAALIPAGTVSSSNQVDITATTNYTTFSSSIATKNDLQDITISSLNAATSSYAINATIQGQLAGVVSSSTQVKPLLPGGTVSSSTQVTANLPAGVVSSSTQLPAGTVSSSGQVSITATTGYSTFSSSIATKNDLQDVSINALNAATSSYAINATIQGQLAGVVSSSTQVKPLLPGGTVSSSGQVDITATANYSTFSSSLATVDAGQTTRIDNLASQTSSYAINATIQGQLAGVVSSSTQVKPLLPDGTVTSSAQYPGWVTASSQIDYNSIQNKLSGVVSSSTQIVPLLPAGTISASSQVALNAITGVTFSNSSFYFPNNLRVEGTLTAQEFNTEFVSSSIIYESGSTKFGDSADDVMSVTGSIRVLAGSISGSMVGMFSSSAQVDYNSIQNKLSGVVSSSTQVKPLLPNGTVTASAQFPGWVTSSTQIVWSSVNYNAGIVSSSAQVKPLLPGGTVSSSGQVDYNSITNKLSGVVSSSAQVKPLLPGGSVSSSTASSPNQGTVRVTINGTNTDVDTGLQTGDSPSFTGLTVTGLNASQAVFTNGSDALVSNTITGTGNVVMSASPTLSGTIIADKMVMSGSQFAGIVSGSGTQYRLVVPVGINLYAT